MFGGVLFVFLFVFCVLLFVFVLWVCFCWVWVFLLSGHIPGFELKYVSQRYDAPITDRYCQISASFILVNSLP